jgi:hypothetical protein
MEKALEKKDRKKLNYHANLWTEAVEELRCSTSTGARTTTRTTHESGV